jgi:uncharacterized membrane protein
LLVARPQLFVAALVALAVGLSVPAHYVQHPVTRLLIAWNAGACLYVALAAIAMIRSSQHHMRRRAQLQDENEWTILAATIVAAVASVAAIGGELVVVRDLHGAVAISRIALAGLTVLSSWAFVQVMFCLHYAHEYYAAVERGHPPGLSFPGDEEPDYGDFFYFAVVIGTSAQTADVSFVTRSMRRIGTVHCIVAYLFNATVLALLVNIGASLI